MKPRYYSCTRRLGNSIITDIWHATTDTMRTIGKSYDFIIPLDRKPRNTPIKEACTAINI